MLIANDIVKLIPNQSEAVKSLAEQYRKFAKASSEDILGLAETVYVANRGTQYALPRRVLPGGWP